MKVHKIEWFEKNCWYGKKYDYYYRGYFYLDKNGYLPDEGRDICGKSVERISGNLYKIIGGFKIKNSLVYNVNLPEWFIENNVLEVE